MAELFDKDYMKASAKFKDASKEQVEAFKKYKETLTKGPFDKKTSELLMLAAGIAIQCDYCIDSHSKKAKAAGATPEELAFVVHLAAEVKHGATISYGLKALQE